MKKNNQVEISSELEERIISVAYGDASFLEKRRIYKLASSNADVKKLLDEYSQTAKSVRLIPHKIYKGKKIAKEINTLNRKLSEEIYLIFISKPVLSVMATVLLIFAITFSVITNKKVTYDGYTFAEVQQARIESEEALLIVNKIFNKTEKRIRNDILLKEISKPINKGIKSVNKLFKEK